MSEIVSSSTEQQGECSQPSKRIRRSNTLEEKRRMRIGRKRRKRQSGRNPTVTENTRELHCKISQQNDLLYDRERTIITYKCMAKTYWERWRYELEERKQYLSQEREIQFKMKHCIPLHQDSSPALPCIDRSLLSNPNDVEVYLARGSFGIVKFQEYRGLPVAVKEFLPRTRADSVKFEANILLKLSHLYLPLLFGICTATQPYIMVMQYHSVDGKCTTLQKEVIQKKVIPIGSYKTWIVLCGELAEAFRYLHDDAGILHNDLKSDNVVLANSFTQQPSHSIIDFQIVVVDFGKATEKDKGHRYQLTFHEKEQYRIRFRHMAPEVIDGSSKQSVRSDIYALGKLFRGIGGDATLLQGISMEYMEQFKQIAANCTSTRTLDRPFAHQVCAIFERMLKRMY